METRTVSVVMIGIAETDQRILKERISDIGTVAASIQSLSNAPVLVKKHPSAIALIYLDDSPEEVLKLTKELSDTLSQTIVIVSKNQDPQNILLAMKAGAKDFAYLNNGNASDVRRALVELHALQEHIQRDRNGKVVTVFSAKGGSGATTIASNLAGVLLTYGLERKDPVRKIALIDFDLAMGDISVFLDMEMRFGFLDLLSNIHRLDADLLYQSLNFHSSGLYVVTNTHQLEESDKIEPSDMTTAINFLRQYFDFVIVDGLRDFGEFGIVALDHADHILLTMTPDVPSLRNTNRCLQLFNKLDYDPHKIHLVLNRYNKFSRISADAISDALGKPVSNTVTNNFPLVIKAINKGELLFQQSPGSKVAKDMNDLGSLFIKAAKPKRQSFLPFRRS